MATRRGSTKGTPYKRDFRNEEYREPGEGYQGEEPTKGIYPAVLVSVQEHTSQNDTESLHWIFELTEDAIGKNGDSYAGWRGHVYTNDEAAAWKEQQILVGLGLMKPNGTISTTLEQMAKKAKPCKVRIDRERYIPDDGDPEWRAKIGSVMMDRDGGATKSKRSKDEDVDEEDYDDEPEDVDEDEEEEPEPPARSRRASRSRKAEPEPEEDEEEEAEEPEDEEEEAVDPDELAEELEGLSLAALKKRAREEYGVKITRGMTADDIIDAVLEGLEAEDADDEPEEEEEPEPPKRGRSSRSAKTAAKATPSRSRRGSKKAEDDEPPF